jgi:hypothetical protein
MTTTGQPATTTTTAPSKGAFAACLTRHGFPASVGSAGSTPGRTLSIFGVIVPGHVDPASAGFQSAMQACRQYLPGGGPPALSPSQQARWTTAMTKFAACMRKHGVPSFPDPKGQGFAPGALGGMDPQSPFVQAAFKACQSLEPTFGPRIEVG